MIIFNLKGSSCICIHTAFTGSSWWEWEESQRGPSREASLCCGCSSCDCARENHGATVRDTVTEHWWYISYIGQTIIHVHTSLDIWRYANDDSVWLRITWQPWWLNNTMSSTFWCNSLLNMPYMNHSIIFSHASLIKPLVPINESKWWFWFPFGSSWQIIFKSFSDALSYYHNTHVVTDWCFAISLTPCLRPHWNPP